MKKFLVLLICINLIGCALVSDYYISQPTDIGINYKFWPENEIVTFNLGDVTLYLQPQNSVSVAEGEMLLLPIPIMRPRKEVTKDYTKSTYLFKEYASSILDVVEGNYFYIEILLKAKKDGCFFNPKEVYLKLENNEYIQASKYLIPDIELGGPSKVARYPLLHTKEYSWRIERNEQAASKYFKIPPKGYTGFAIRFETPTPNPGTPFNIEIKGLKYLENTMPIPKIRYKNKIRIREYRTS